MLEPRYFIRIEDILRAQFECKHCHAQISFQPNSSFPFTCPLCNTDWFDRQDINNTEKYAREITFALMSVVRVKEAFEKRKVALSFEIQGEKAH
jgi:hypothetical protein